MSVHVDHETPVGSSLLLIARAGMESSAKNLERIALLTGVDIANEGVRAQVFPKLALMADELAALMLIARDGIPRRRSARRKLAAQIAHHTTEVAILAGQIKQAIGEPNAHSNEAQTPGEVQAGQDSPEERPDQRD